MLGKLRNSAKLNGNSIELLNSLEVRGIHG